MSVQQYQAFSRADERFAMGIDLMHDPPIIVTPPEPPTKSGRAILTRHHTRFKRLFSGRSNSTTGVGSEVGRQSWSQGPTTGPSKSSRRRSPQQFRGRATCRCSSEFPTVATHPVTISLRRR
jgi:hypothetical protein